MVAKGFSHGPEPMRTWCGAYIHDEHIGYVACKKRVSLMQEAYIFDVESLFLRCTYISNV